MLLTLKSCKYSWSYLLIYQVFLWYVFLTHSIFEQFKNWSFETYKFELKIEGKKNNTKQDFVIFLIIFSWFTNKTLHYTFENYLLDKNFIF